MLRGGEPPRKMGGESLERSSQAGRWGDKIKSLALEPSESIKTFWKVLRGDFEKKIPNSPEL